MEPAVGGPPVLLVDDDPRFLLSCGVTLRTAGISPVATIEDSRQVIPFLKESEVAAVVIDLTMPHLSGRDLLQKLKELYPELPVVVMTGHNEVEIAVECMRAGAFDYLVKPVEPSRFVSCIRRALEVRSLRAEVDSLKEHFLSGQLRNSRRFRGDRNAEPEDAGRLPVHRGRRPFPAPRAGHRGDGDGEGAGGPRHPRPQRVPRGAGVRERGGTGRRPVLRYPLRAPQGGVHRGRPAPGRG